MNKIKVTFKNKNLIAERLGKSLLVISNVYAPNTPMFIVRSETGELNRKYIHQCGLEEVTFQSLKKYLTAVIAKVKKKGKKQPEIVSIFTHQKIESTDNGIRLMSDQKCLAEMPASAPDLFLRVSDYQCSTERLEKQFREDLFPAYIQQFGFGCDCGDAECFDVRINALATLLKKIEAVEQLDDQEPEVHLSICDLPLKEVDQYGYVRDLLDQVGRLAPIVFFDRNGQFVESHMRMFSAMGYPVFADLEAGSGEILTKKGIVHW